jgi:hypothetical protein
LSAQSIIGDTSTASLTYCVDISTLATNPRQTASRKAAERGKREEERRSDPLSSSPPLQLSGYSLK